MTPGGPGPVLRPGGAQVIPRPHLWWAVPHPTPAPYPLHVSTDDVVRAVQAQPCSRPNIAPEADSLPAAVLVVLADGPDGEAGVLLTRRSQLMRRNPGEISFPGGRLDPGETPEQAAVREAYEEVGLDPAAVELVGSLDHLATVVHPSFVVPVVGRTATQLELVPTSIEAERVLWVPLADLVRPDTFHVERWGREPSSRLLFFFELDDETVWGLTAFVLTDLLERLAPAAA